MPPAAFIAAISATLSISGTGATLVTALVPTTVQSGDSLLFVIAANSVATGDVSPSSLPTGWSVFGHFATATRVVNVLRRIATDTEPPSHTITTVGTTGAPIAIGGALLVYRGLDSGAAGIDGGIVDVTTSTDFPCPSLTLTAYSDLYLGIAMTPTFATTFVEPDGAAELTQAFLNVELEVFQVLQEATGATGTQTATASDAVSGLAAAIALRTLPPLPAPAITPDVPGAIGFVTVGV